ncbi:hypothetical protein SDC9_76247 [bioreactor metagenome]|uniref:Uncharacterized protein n=1 Tax=bioreactor metagenome TaxID=1076179 RepID=A0A644YN47_9ZZZZ
MTAVAAEGRPYYALHLDRPDFIYAGVALWLAFPAPVAGDGVVPFPHRLPRPVLDHLETRLAHHYAGSMERLLKTTPLRSGATVPTPISEITCPSSGT